MRVARVGWRAAVVAAVVVSVADPLVLRAQSAPVGSGGRGQSAPAVPAWVAQARTDQNSMIAHAQLLEKRTRGRIDVYFAGDSIVRRWGATDYPQLLANWNENFRGWNVANFGWGADRIQNILWRLDHGELDDVHPKVIVLLAGTNNVGARPGDASKVAEITRGIEAVLTLMRQKAPGAVIVLTAIFPRNDNLAVMPTIDAVNAHLKTLADGRTIRFLNINDRLAGADGRVFDGLLTADRLHPAVAGYQIWADALAPIFTELLGPRAAEDAAPPPTGDPSAAGRSAGQP
jgi:lysophospholipase L1-like esterase